MDYIVGQYYNFRNESILKEFDERLVGIPKEFLNLKPKKLIDIRKEKSYIDGVFFNILSFENIGIVPFGFREDSVLLEKVILFTQEEMEI